MLTYKVAPILVVSRFRFGFRLCCAQLCWQYDIMVVNSWVSLLITSKQRSICDIVLMGGLIIFTFLLVGAAF
jgi:hypothetical protein